MAMAELLPSGGPVKGSVIGQKTPEVLAQAARVEEYMNYQLTVEDRGYYEERDQMLYLLPFSGSEFDKQYADPVTKRVVSRWVRCDDFIVPYDTTSLESAARYTHRLRMTQNEYRKAVQAEFYTSGLLTNEPSGSVDDSPLTETLTDLDGQEKPSSK